MRSVSNGGRRALAAGTGIAITALALTACGGGDGNGGSGGSSGGALIIGTTDKITSIDPAGSYDNGSFAVMNQGFPFLLNTPYGSPDGHPDTPPPAEPPVRPPGRQAGHRLLGRFHVADRVHRQAQARAEVGQRARPHVVGREVQLRPAGQDQ